MATNTLAMLGLGDEPQAPDHLRGLLGGDGFGNVLQAMGASLMSSPRNAPLSNFGSNLQGFQQTTMKQRAMEQEQATAAEEKARRQQLAQYAMSVVPGNLQSLAQADPESALRIWEGMKPAAPSYGWEVINGQLVRTDSGGGATPMGQFGNQPRPMTAEERAVWGIPTQDATPYFFSDDGTPKALSGSSLVTVNTGDPGGGELRTALDKQEGETWAGYLSSGAVSGANAADFQVLDELIGIAPQGPITGRLAETFKGFSSAGDAFQSIVKRIAPTLRAPGSGSTSDIEYDGMLRSLPGLSNAPEANRMINEIMKAKAAINVERAAVIRQYQTGQIDLSKARQMIGDLDSRSIMTPAMQQTLVGIGGNANSNAGQTSGGLTWSVK